MPSNLPLILSEFKWINSLGFLIISGGTEVN